MILHPLMFIVPSYILWALIIYIVLGRRSLLKPFMIYNKGMKHYKIYTQALTRRIEGGSVNGCPWLTFFLVYIDALKKKLMIFFDLDITITLVFHLVFAQSYLMMLVIMIIKLCLNDVYITLYVHWSISMCHESVSIFYKCLNILYNIDMECNRHDIIRCSRKSYSSSSIIYFKYPKRLFF